MAEEQKKLGPNVTYVGQGEGDKNPITMAGVRFEPGKSVNIEDRLGKAGAPSLLKKLAGNRYFKVDGGPDHEAEQKKREELQAKEAEDDAKRSQDELQRQQRQQQEDLQRSGQRRAEQEGRIPPPPENYEGPDEETLEKPSSRKR